MVRNSSCSFNGFRVRVRVVFNVVGARFRSG